MTCTFGMAPVSLIVNPSRTKFLSNMPRANIMDYAPMVNILPFGMCNTLSNPTVAAATSAAMGVLTPMPCIPSIVAPWMPGNMQCMVQGQPALTRNSQCTCMWGGLIRFTTDGQMPAPPPVIVPPIEVPAMPIPLSMEERSRMSDEEQEQYEEDMKEAAKAGNGDLEIAKNLDNMAKRYEDEGNYAKAKQAQKASQQFKERAAEKQANAMSKAIDKYRNGGNEGGQAAEKPMSKEELNNIYTDARKNEDAKRKEIADLDRQIEENSKEWHKSEENLNKANDKLVETSGPYQEAKAQRQQATSEREDLQNKAAFFAQNEKIARESEHPNPAAIELNRKEKEKYEKAAKEAEKKEERLMAKEQKTKKEYDKAAKAQREAAEDYHEHMEAYSDLSDKKKEAEAAKNKSSNTAFAAMRAMEAQEQQEKHQAAVERHEEAKVDTREKRLTMDEYAREENIAKKEADAWFSSGRRAHEQGDDELASRFYANTARYDEQAKEALINKEEARKEYESSKDELKQAYKEAYSDDAMLDSYTADLEWDKAMKDLNRK